MSPPTKKKTKTKTKPQFYDNLSPKETLFPWKLPLAGHVKKVCHKNFALYIYIYSCYMCRCPSLSYPLDSLTPGGQANRGWLAPQVASCPGISCPPPWLSSPPGGGQAVQAGLSCPPPPKKNRKTIFFHIL